jgi:hypothetical protein
VGAAASCTTNVPAFPALFRGMRDSIRHNSSLPTSLRLVLPVSLLSASDATLTIVFTQLDILIFMFPVVEA